MPLILGLETSCDETGAAVVEDGVRVRSNIIATQHKLHERYGGVVPEIASRAHLERISPVIHEALATAGVGLDDIDAVAVGNRPGLIGSLLVGVAAAKTLAWSLEKPLIGIDHVKAHLYAGLMEQGTGVRSQESGAGREETRTNVTPASATRSSSPPDACRLTPVSSHFPALGLVVSGGHTSLYELTSPLQMRVIGRTIDDAVGEAYDKVAVILNVGYPGGPRLDKLAQTGSPAAHRLPRSMLGDDSLDFSFSGLKTAMLYKVRGQPVGRGEQATFERTADDLTDEERRNLAAAFQEAAIDTLILKLDRAVEQLADRGQRPRSLLVGGGVSANSLLRRRAVEFGQSRQIEVRLPPMSLCLDNAAMIAGLAFEYYKKGEFSDFSLEAVSTSRG